MASSNLTERSGSVDGTIEKKDSLSVDQINVSLTSDDKDGELLSAERRPSAERKLVRILDFRLLPTIILIYILNYIDVSKHCPFELEAANPGL